MWMNIVIGAASRAARLAPEDSALHAFGTGLQAGQRINTVQQVVEATTTAVTGAGAASGTGATGAAGSTETSEATGAAESVTAPEESTGLLATVWEWLSGA